MRIQDRLINPHQVISAMIYRSTEDEDISSIRFNMADKTQELFFLESEDELEYIVSTITKAYYKR